MQIERIPITIDERFAETSEIDNQGDKNMPLVLMSILLLTIASVLTIAAIQQENESIIPTKKQGDER